MKLNSQIEVISAKCQEGRGLGIGDWGLGIGKNSFSVHLPIPRLPTSYPLLQLFLIFNLSMAQLATTVFKIHHGLNCAIASGGWLRHRFV
ncbi:hypothetical protein CLI64_14810 [Nostoc sp. CENA543]|uniref:hypothetical protein n=1 Tax=Nostoc sp. CENA543 TaxID=1869241 RepID=UPI000CA2B0F2|nr:hypothetical protein [Nostoc sp. CENA543]AUT01557.1 hypothetical protein CLI64_14810 [Nostoc sp. CENA543]